MVGQWTLQVEQAIDKNYELFEAYCIRNVFSLPAGHVPPHMQKLKTSEECAEDVDAELAAVMAELQKVQGKKQ